MECNNGETCRIQLVEIRGYVDMRQKIFGNTIIVYCVSVFIDIKEIYEINDILRMLVSLNKMQ